MATKGFQQNSESKNSNSLIQQQKNSKSANRQADKKEELEEELIRKHYGLVFSQALYFLDDPNFDDYIQSGLIGLLKAIRDYDHSKAKFSTFATVCIRNEIKNTNKKAKRHRLNNHRSVTEKDKQYNNKEALSECLPESLSEEYKFIISLRIQNYTNAEIAGFLSCSKADVKEKIRMIISILKEHNQ